MGLRGRKKNLSIWWIAGYGERAEETQETDNMRKRGLPDGAVNLFA